MARNAPRDPATPPPSPSVSEWDDGRLGEFVDWMLDRPDNAAGSDKTWVARLVASRQEFYRDVRERNHGRSTHAGPR